MQESRRGGLLFALIFGTLISNPIPEKVTPKQEGPENQEIQP